MKKCDVVLWRLVPADQNAPEPVEPTVSSFHHPASGFETGLPFDGLSLFSSAADVGGEAELVQGAAHLREVVPFVQAHTLGLSQAGRRSIHRHAVHCEPHQLHVVAVGPVHCQPHRNALGFSQQAALDAPLASVGGVGAGFSPHPGAIWSWLRPCSTSSSPDPSVRHSVPVPPATTPETPQRQPTAESGDGRWTQSRCPWHPTLSTGNRCVARRRCRWRRCGQELGVDRRRSDACSHARGSTAPVLPRVRRRSGNRRWWDWSWRPDQPASDAAAWGLSLWSLPKSRRNPASAARNRPASCH